MVSVIGPMSPLSMMMVGVGFPNWRWTVGCPQPKRLALLPLAIGPNNGVGSTSLKTLVHVLT
jgi:hypothetical protein